MSSDTSNTPKILIYGAIAEPQKPRPQFDLKHGLKVMRDVALSKVRGRLSLNCLDYAWPNSNVGDEAIAEATNEQFHRRFSAQCSNVNWGDLGRYKPVELNATHRLLVVAGSGYFIFSAESKLPQRLRDDLDYFSRATVPVVLFGVGVNHLFDASLGVRALKMSSDNRALIEGLLSRAALISVRDTFSKTVLSEFTDKPIVLLGDPALFLTANTNTNHAKRQTGGDSWPRVGINFPLHGILVEKQLKENFKEYVRILKTFRQESGCTYEYFMHSDYELPVPYLLRSHGIKLSVVRGGPLTLAQKYRGLSLHLAGMLHSSILATGAEVPCVALAYDTKHQGFFDLVGMGAHCHSASPLDSNAVLQSMRDLLHDTVSAKIRIAQGKATLAAATAQFLDQCAPLIDGARSA